MTKQPVLIVGAGPTGLVLALWLTKAGIPVRIIDKLPTHGTTSRALVFHARNLEFYRQMGIDQYAVQQGVEAKISNLWLRGKAVGQIRFGDFKPALSRYPYALIFPQDLHEKMLIEQLESLNVRVERQTELVHCTQSDDGVTAELRNATGNIETCQFPYLAGCDGARSTVREKIGAEFPGGTYSDTYYVADIEASGPVINGQLNIALDDADFLAVFPMKGEGCARLVGSVRKDISQGRDLRWEDVGHRIIEHLKMEVKAVKWFSTYRVHHRVASIFHKERIFLLGDAAHLHSPVGGQGMNTGIGDAVNLAWKLAAVLKGESPATLLSTYEPERIAFARRLVETTDRVFAFISARGGFAKWVRLHIVPRLLPFLFQFAAIRKTLYSRVSQIAIAYPESSLSHGPSGTDAGGQRLPWIQFNEEGGPKDNFEMLSSRSWQVHVYGEGDPDIKSLCESIGVEFHQFPWRSEMEKAGLMRDASYVIRPDGYIGIVEPPRNLGKVLLYLETWISKR